MKVLVAYASKHGATQGIAEAIAEQLRVRGLSAEAIPAAADMDLGSADAVVLGSAIYVGSWRDEAVEFARGVPMPQTQEGPRKIKPKGLADYLDVLTRAVFQSGISWRVVEAKWPGTIEAFGGFDPERVANLTPADVDALATDTRLIRNRAKINATEQNAETMLALDREHGSFNQVPPFLPDI